MEFHTVIFFGLDGQSWWSLRSKAAVNMHSFFVALTKTEQRSFFTCRAERERPIDWLEELLGDTVSRASDRPSKDVLHKRHHRNSASNILER